MTYAFARVSRYFSKKILFENAFFLQNFPLDAAP